VYAALTGATFLLPVTLQVVSGALCAVGGLLAAVTITNPAREHRMGDAAMPDQCLHCGLDAPPLITTTGQSAGTG
jgi:hypothetical protein